MSVKSVFRGMRDSILRHTGIVAAAIKQELVYRFNFFTSIIFALLTMSLLYFLWTAIYRNSTSISMTYESLITYICVGQAFSFARPSQRRTFMRISWGVQTGNIVLDLARPSDFQAMCLSDMLGTYIMETIMVSIPSFLLAIFVFGVDLPASPEVALGFVASLASALFLVFSLDFLLGNLSFWTTSVWGISYAKMAVMEIFAGGIIPLTLFPDWLRGIVMGLPFKDMAYTPLAIYIGEIRGDEIWTSVLKQILWGIALVILTRLVWLKARRRIEIQGG